MVICETFHPSDWAILEGLEESVDDGVNERLNLYLTILPDFLNHPIHFKIMSDVAKVFLDLPEGKFIEWVVGNSLTRLELLNKSSELRDPQVFCKYLLYKSRQLEITYQTYEQPIYILADAWLKSIAFNQDDGLMNIFNSPYGLPEESDYHMEEPDGGYQ